ncbi:phosphate ABC transporter, periplasmic phosphate-binding protein [Desulfovibrio sp. X2]|uniref:phosphate ABC transporter substrate-binding protein PstS n=1 Tax=Desulfovibrio sp. X2 TaxID=941449 RepID=UPI000358C848|nr:phosphate ABC transporter substrate-binding protein PstS [Desulfovibrio sp. X2]EPR36298.1 phosphate ABC transporter, periplasmic phosphate-binding protein [Desulfovibrio sp. X2]
MRIDKIWRAALGCLMGLALLGGTAMAGEITGAGATFPYPVYAKWAQAYEQSSGVKLNYQSIGSGGGIKQIEAKTVGFGASDKPLEAAELDKQGLVQWPQIMGGVVPVVNIKGVKPGEIRLSGKVLADIYLGKITMWNDAAIAKLNKGVKLPAQAIAVVHRSDGSGTTFNFTNYLIKVSPEWKDKVGCDTSVEWPVGIGGKGNEGVANFTARTNGSIGYVEYAYALQNKLAYCMMQNQAGNFVKPNSASFQAAAANADWLHTPGMHVVLTDQPGKDSWPITAASFILMHKSQENPEQAREILKFFAWSFKNGGKMADSLDYVSIPKNVVETIETMWSKDIKSASGEAVWK